MEERADNAPEREGRRQAVEGTDLASGLRMGLDMDDALPQIGQEALHHPRLGAARGDRPMDGWGMLQRVRLQPRRPISSSTW